MAYISGVEGGSWQSLHKNWWQWVGSLALLKGAELSDMYRFSSASASPPFL
jgi:hypothetical protein